MSRRLIVVLVAVLAPACAGIGVRDVKRPTLFADWRASALAADNKPSPRTVQTLRIYALDDVYDRDPDEGIKRLHATALADPQPDTVFALAELSYLRGQAVAKKKPDDAVRHYVRCCAYAQHYLLASSVEAGSVVHASASDQLSMSPLSPRDAFDPRFRLACNLYNGGLSQSLRAAQKCGRLDPRCALTLPTEGGEEIVPVTHTGFAWRAGEFGPVAFCEDYEVVGLANLYRDYGLGVPLIGSVAPEADVDQRYYSPRVRFPITALIRFEGGLADLDRPNAARLDLYNPRTIQAARFGRHSVPLESDLTTPLAKFLDQYPAETIAFTGFFRADRLRAEAGVKFVEPYQPGKIPVLLVHGLLSSPVTWAPMFNDLQADPQLRERFQFWVYFYPTGDPYLATAADLRKKLDAIRAEFDPHHQDPALDQLVLVGHSMGGLVSHLQTVPGGDDFWKLVSDEPIQQVKSERNVKSDLEETFYFKSRMDVTRVIFLGTPHRGSKLSPSFPARLARRFIRAPKELMDDAQDLATLNPTLKYRQLPDSVDLLAPDAPALLVLNNRPRPATVHYHSVIGLAPKCSSTVERWIAWDSSEPGDGVVPASSAHFDGAESELVVPADHFHVHQHPLAVREVRRILLEHAAKSGLPAPRQ
jgi:pimeloyl-ACP methyl ester carboxylesterase